MLRKVLSIRSAWWPCLILVAYVLAGCKDNSLQLPANYQYVSLSTGPGKDIRILIRGVYAGGPSLRYQYAVQNNAQTVLPKGSTFLIQFVPDTVLTFENKQIYRYLSLKTDLAPGKTTEYADLPEDPSISISPGRVLGILLRSGDSSLHQGYYSGYVSRDSASTPSDGKVVGWIADDGELRFLIARYKTGSGFSYEQLQGKVFSASSLAGSLAGESILWPSDSGSWAKELGGDSIRIQLYTKPSNIRYTFTIQPKQAQ